MNATQPTQLAAQINGIVDFCLKRGKRTAVGKLDREAAFRYVAFCMLTGKLAFSYENNQIEAVAFYWAGHREHIEAKFAEDLPQFEWTMPKHGDCLFLGDCIGSREGIARIYQSVIEKFPNMITVPILTYRRGNLVCLTNGIIERFIVKGLK